MPFAIKIAQRTEIHPTFLSAVEFVYGSYYDNLVAHSTDANEFRRKLSSRPAIARRLLDWKNGVEAERSGLNYDIQARIQTHNKYQKMYGLEATGKTWLVGRTHNIVLTGRTSADTLNMGPYDVCVSATDLTKLSLVMHLIPLKSPRTGLRHPHHKTTPLDGKNPLEFSPDTCWGSFGTGTLLATQELDIAGLFAMLFEYVSRYDPGSPLVFDLRRNSLAEVFTWAQ